MVQTLQIFQENRKKLKSPQRISNIVDSMLIDTIEKAFIDPVKRYLEENKEADPNFYNLANGFWGVLSYLLLSQNQSRLNKLTTECLATLLQLLNRTFLKDGLQHQPAEESQIKYSEESFYLRTRFGLSGVLASLSLSAISGGHSPGLMETVSKLAYWLMNTREENTHGVPGALRSLFLASAALKDKSLQTFTVDSFLSLFYKPNKEWNVRGPSLIHGKAGILAITYRMAQDIQNPVPWKQVNVLEEELKWLYKSDAPFVFRMVSIDAENNYQCVDHPGFFLGAGFIN